MTEPNPNFKIEVVRDGPYRVRGGVPLRKMSQVCTNKGEPVDWKDHGAYETKQDSYILCRCGQTNKAPFCDGRHVETGFVGDETAVTSGPWGRKLSYYGPDGLTVSKIVRLCMNSGFCVLVDTDFIELTEESGDPVKKARAIKMVEDCPSGSLVYQTERDGAEVEPNLPAQIADTFECTSYGEIQGPLWVTGYIPIERSDKAPFTPRNRVTLCTCGHSRIKPLCDGTHRPLYEHRLRAEARKKQIEELRKASENDNSQNLG